MRIFRSFVLILIPAAQVFCQGNYDSLITALNEALDRKKIYETEKLQHINVLQQQLINIDEAPLAKQFEVYNKLYHQYKVFVYDSAFKYAEKLQSIAHTLHDRTKINYAALKMSFIHLSAGMFKETFDSLKVIDKTALHDSSKVEYHQLMARAYFDVSHYDNDLRLDQNYFALGRRHLDSAQRISKPNSFGYLYVSNQSNLMSGNIHGALNDIMSILRMPSSIHARAINKYHLGEIYLAHGNEQKALEAFVASAIADIESVTKENTALNKVADILYKKGDIKNAYRYIEASMEDALFYGANQRKTQIGTILHIIGSEKLNHTERESRKWLIYSSVIMLLGTLLFAFGIVIIKQVKKLKVQVNKLQIAEQSILKANEALESTNQQLRENEKIKEEYIGYYFNTNSDYLDKIENVLQSIDHKLTNKKYDDIRFIINSLNIKRQKEELFVSFDKLFLKLFPDFVTTFNSFFKQEDQIILSEDELLTTELRIFALIRMGINDNKKIAKVLGYSVNSIYAYKTKIKNKSTLPNDEFEKKIMEIKSV